MTKRVRSTLGDALDTEARSIANAITSPVRRARCEAAIATLEARPAPVLRQVA